jgi:chromosome segregation ATPase
MVNQTVVNFPGTEAVYSPQSELISLRNALQERDALIRQLVSELVKVNQQNRVLQGQVSLSGTQEADQDQICALQMQNAYLETNIRDLEQQLEAVQATVVAREADLQSEKQYLEAHVHQLEAQIKGSREEIDAREAGLRALLGKIQTLSGNNRQLEQHLQEVPELYRRKFTERMNPVAEKIQGIQSENYRLQLEMQGMAQKLLAVQEVLGKPMLPAPTPEPEESQQTARLLADLFGEIETSSPSVFSH